jgi:hypothetical protein
MNNTATTKPWYKHWWGVLIAICIWPFFLVWLMWRKGNKTGIVGKLAGSVGIVVLAIIVIVAIASATKQGANSTNNVASTTPKPVAPKSVVKAQPKTAATATVIAKLNRASVPVLSPVLTDFEGQMANGQSYATQPNAADANSAYHKWALNEEDAENVSNNKEQVAAYNKADNMYYDAHVTAPNALSSWDTDAGDIPGDMSNWADAEYSVLVDQMLNSNSLSSDQATAKTDLANYQTDLAKAQVDIQKL